MLTQAELKRQLHYDPETGIFTRLVTNAMCIKVGDIAGSKRTDGYIAININKKVYSAHRLAWLYVYGELPVKFIDHINMIRDDNRIDNLRQATNQQNKFNAGIRKDNKTGYKGVTFCKQNNKWKSESRLNGVIHYFGYFTTPELAHEAYKQFAIKHHGEFIRI
jgi:hypothetical protein